jgi:hypothetical protein
MMFDGPHEIETQAVGQFHLVESVLEQDVLVIGAPRPRQLVFVENSEPHGPPLPILVFEHGIDQALDQDPVPIGKASELDREKGPVVVGLGGVQRQGSSSGGGPTHAGQDVFDRHLEGPGHPFQDVLARVGKEPYAPDGFLAARFEVTPQGLGDLGPAGRIAPAQATLFTLLDQPSSEFHPLARLVHLASVPVPAT